MKRFYEHYEASDPKVLRRVELLPWSHILLLISKKLGDDETLYYAEETIKKRRINAIRLAIIVSPKQLLLRQGGRDAVG